MVELPLFVQTVGPEEEAAGDVGGIGEIVPDVDSGEVVVEELGQVPPGTFNVCPTSN